MKSKGWLLLIPLFLVQSCIKKDFSGATPANPDSTTIDNLQIDPAFTFNTGNNVSVKITTLDNADNIVPNIRVNIYSDYPENGGQLISSCFTGSRGVFTGTVKLPAYADSLVLETSAIGFVPLQKRKINANSIDCIFGGSNPVINRREAPPAVNPSDIGNLESSRPTGIDGVLGAGPIVKAMGTINSLGVPNYLTSPNDVIDASFLTDINNALPEYKPVPTYHPQYLTQNSQTNLVFQQAANVWVTFVHEGAGYKNTLCYYKYDPNHPPLTASDVDTIFTVFPNTSYINSGGGLVSGNKVKLGTFQPGMAIGWALIANGYNGSAVTAGLGTFYSDEALNPETTASLKKHCILLNDVNRDKLLLSFEDINRSNSGCDNDFNDAIFYVTADPITAINITNIARPAYTSVDADNDGVTDNFDDYPTDPTKAFNNYYPSQNTVGSLAFEDLWPSKGDYDFNDMVIDYNFNPITNANNEVVQIKAAITIKAIGASFHNGFGIQLPINSNLVSGVTGTDVRGSMIVKNANGTEAGQTKATIIVFDDAFTQLPWPGGGIGVNTTLNAPYVEPKTLTLVIDLTQPISANTMGLPPYNAFIFTNKNRGSEVHLINQKPTDLANTALLGTQQDNSNPSTGRYYVTSKNLPFAIDIAGPFEYPVEKKVIVEGHLKFAQWAESKGLQFMDWFKPITGYQNQAHIFRH
jgi:LruC domain-containing protein